MKILVLVCAALFVVLLLALVVTRFFIKKCKDEDLLNLISLSIGLLMILDCVGLILGVLYIRGEMTTFWTSLVLFVLGFLFSAGERKSRK